MVKTVFRVAAVAAASATALAIAPAVASAAPGAGPSQATTVTFAVTSGQLTLTAPASVNLGSSAPGGTITNQLGSVSVSDTRALLSATWVASASATAWTTGTATASETIPAADVAYAPGSITTTGTITATGSNLTGLSAAPAAVVTGSAGIGNNTATWNPTLTVSVPAQAVGGTYTGTITHSVA